MADGAPRTFKVAMSERCYRFKPDALPSHAPDRPGVYEFVTFDPAGTPIVLFVGYALSGSVGDALGKHLTGQAEPTASQLFASAKDIYFDFVARADIQDVDDLKDIAGALIARHQPRFNVGEPPSSGKYASVSVEEVG